MVEGLPVGCSPYATVLNWYDNGGDYNPFWGLLVRKGEHPKLHPKPYTLNPKP